MSYVYNEDLLGKYVIDESETNRHILVKKYKNRGFDFIFEQGNDIFGLTTLQAKQLIEALQYFIEEF